MSRKNVKIYGICIAGMLLLVILAMLLPQIVWEVQDRFRINSVELQQRSSIDVSQVNSDYERQMYSRMSNLTELDIETATVAAIDYDKKDDEEMNAVLARVFTSEWIERFNETTYCIYQDALIRAFIEISDCKKYIVYGEDYQDGVALMMWFFDINMKEYDTRVRLLVDSETDTIYYIKITNYDEETKKNYYEVENYSKDNSMQVENYSKDNRMLFGMFEKNVLTCLGYYSDYYESNWHSDDWDYWYTQVRLDDTQLNGKYVLPYGKKQLEFQFIATAGECMNPDVEMGITLIGELIPEMMQN